jgi:DNA mismatch endonuclease, patch repair protein
MRATPGVDTKPEIALRSSLHRRGYRFRKDHRVLVDGKRVRIDCAFPAEQLAVFMDGCFWHRCPTHRSVPHANRQYWEPKLARNVERDRNVNAQLEAAGWTVLRIWEHVPVEAAVELVSATLDRLRRAGMPTAVDLFAGAGRST